MSKHVKVIAHRGGRLWAPENTMAAFERALELRVDGIELDVQRCATGELVVIHDEDLARTTNGVGLVKDVSFDELRRLSAGKWFDEHFVDEKIPSLQEVLDLVAGRCMLNIEVKNAPVSYEGIEEELVEMLASYPSRETLIVSSFDHHVLARIHELDGALALGLLVDSIMVGLPEYASALGCKYYHPGMDSLRQDVVELCHAHDIAVNPWTVNGRQSWSRMIKVGVDGIVTDDPEGLMVMLKRAAPVGADI